MNILTLDLSLSSTGYTVYTNGEIVEVDRIVSVNKEGGLTKNQLEYTYFYGSVDENSRLYHLMVVIEQLIIKYDIDTVVIESQYVGNNRRVGLMLSSLKGAVTYLSRSNDCELIVLTPSEIRKELLGQGNGRASKEIVAEYIREYYYDAGEFSDKTGKKKTSDMYDAISILIAYLNMKKIPNNLKKCK